MSDRGTSFPLWPQAMARLGVVSKDRYQAQRAKADTLADAIRDILDLATGWSRPMSDAKRLEFIEQIGKQALDA